jgi:glycosyltransferase involved in cell wall biosynthesis
MTKVCFYVGYTPFFNGQNFKDQQVFGSETSVIYLAEEYAKDPENDVTVFVYNIRKNNMELTHHGVHYVDCQDIHKYENIDKMIVSRYMHFFLMYKVVAKETILWIHDSVPNYAYDSKQLPNIGIQFMYNLCKFKVIDKIVFVSEYQRQNTLKHYDLCDVPTQVIPNGIPDLDIDINKFKRISNRLLFNADPTRGLDFTLDCFAKIQEQIPDASLVLFRKQEFKEDVIGKIGKLKNITCFGKVSPEKMAEEFCKTDIWLYPTSVPETYCICALEAQKYGAVCACSNIGGMATTVGDCGLTFNKLELDYVVGNTVNLMKNNEMKEDYRKKGYNNAEGLKWNKVYGMWESNVSDTKYNNSRYLVVGSAPYVKDWLKKHKIWFLSNNFKVLPINNAWTLFESNEIYEWHRAEDYFSAGSIIPTKEELYNIRTFIHTVVNNYKHNYISYRNGTMFLNVIYHLLEKLKNTNNSEIVIIGSDMIYNKKGDTFYSNIPGNKAQNDPILKWNNKELQDELDNSKKLYSINKLKIFNASEHITRLPYQKYVNHKVIVSLTSIPPRLKNLEYTIKSILNQTISACKIVLNIPNEYNNFDEPIILPDFLMNNKKIVVNRCKDFGPATKILGLYKSSYWDNICNDDIIIIIDDDRNYNKHMIEVFTEEYNNNEHTNNVLTISGWDIETLTNNKYSYKNKLQPRGNEFSQEGYIDILGGCCGFAMKKYMFPCNKEIFNVNRTDEKYYVDDVWISGFITLNKLNIYLIPNYTKQDEERNINNTINMLYDESRTYKNIKCIEYFRNLQIWN